MTTDHSETHGRWTIAVFAAVLLSAIIFPVMHRDDFHGVHDWFDPVFFHANLLLLTVGIFVAPFLAVTYVVVMRDEKRRRIQSELGSVLWEEHREMVNGYIRSQFAIRNYAVSVLAMMTIVAFGGAVLLLLKPMAGDAGLPAPGLDFTRGGNLLLLGPYVEHFTGEGHFDFLLHSVVAVAFGFLGAYVYSIGQLIRSYFTVDLTPNSFVAASVRLIVASLLTLVFSFAFSLVLAGHAEGEMHEKMLAALPVFGFFFGYFPNRALVAIERLTSRYFGKLVQETGYLATAVNKVSGMNMTHAHRLEREGIDNMENLAASDPVEIALRTGFIYPQVVTWVGEARLRVHLGHDDYCAFAKGTGILTLHQLIDYVARARKPEGVFEQLGAATGVAAAKLEAVWLLYGDGPERPRVVPPTLAPPTLPIRRESGSFVVQAT